MKRSKHNLSHYNVTTGEMGKLMPVGCVEVLPGDSFSASTSALIRTQSLNAPVMHPVDVRIHHFFVPNRLVWSGWEDFITGTDDTPIPTITHSGGANERISDYMGMPPTNLRDVNALPIRAYNKIYNEYYRDQDLVPEIDEENEYIQPIAWGKDYFTAARPTPQKGASASLALKGTAPVNLTSGTGLTPSGLTAFASDSIVRAAVGSDTALSLDDTNLTADLTDASTFDIRDLRKAAALQRYAEARSIYGSRHTEYLRYYGVNPSDARLQRPEYLGGGKQTISFSEVLSTIGGSGFGSVGDLYGHGIAAVRSNKYVKYFEEHGHVITMMSVRPKSIYTQAQHKLWNRLDKEDFYTRELEHIGQQEIQNKEIYQNHSEPDETFGYTNRYDEYRSHPSYVSGEMRDNTYDNWHLARKFVSEPALNQTFTNCEPPKRHQNDMGEPALICMVNNRIQSRRMIAKNPKGKLI